jgi:nucleotide-binding universal stress UspA family protein
MGKPISYNRVLLLKKTFQLTHTFAFSILLSHKFKQFEDLKKHSVKFLIFDLMITTQIRRILVPCDFREDSQKALSYAAFLAKKDQAHVILLHLLKDPSDLEKAEETMRIWVERMRSSYTGEVSSLIEVGSVTEGIGEIASRESCQLVVMPTHGIRGMQHITGSLALRVISESKVPFIIVQQRGIREHGIQKMVVPINFRPQILEELPLIIELAQTFLSEVHLVLSQSSIEEGQPELLGKIEHAFASAGIVCLLHHVSGQNSFAKSVVHYAAGVDADLICGINYSYEYLYTLFPRAEEEDLIYNEPQIPVLLLTPEIQESSIYTIPLWH